MNCYFCQEPCFLESGIYPQEKWRCKNHPHPIDHCVAFRFKPPPHNELLCDDPLCCPYEDFHIIMINWPFRGQIYNVHWDFKGDILTLEQNSNEVIKLHPIPKGVSPETLDKKLRTYILFS